MMHVHTRTVLASLTALLACASAAAPARADFPPYTKVVGVAFVGPVSGDQKALGIQLSNGINLAIDDYNERRNLADFGFVFHSFDDQNDPGVAQQQAEFSMVDPTTSIVIGHVGGEETFMSLPVYHQKAMPLIIPTSPLAELTRTGYENVFRLCPSDIEEGRQAARYAERTLKAKKAAVVYEQTDYGADAGGGFVDYAGAGKALTTKDFAVQEDQKNVKDVVAAVAAYAPDLIYISGNGTDMGAVLAALRQAGVSAPALGTQALFDERAIKSAGASADGLLVSSCVPPLEFMPTTALFVQHYTQRYGRVTSFALMGYVAAQVAISAVVQARSGDKLTLDRQLAIGSFPTILGTYSFQRGGDVANPLVYFYQYAGTQFKYVGSTYPNPLVTR
jgi:branched-chain amino acid transport system substrate-binding protein